MCGDADNDSLLIGGYTTNRHRPTDESLHRNYHDQMSDLDADVQTASEYGGEGPPVAEKPYKIIFEANACFGAGKCAEVSDTWEMDIASGMAKPNTYYIDEDDLDHNVEAAEVCPAKKGDGCIHVVDRRTDEEIAPDPDGDGTLSVDW